MVSYTRLLFVFILRGYLAWSDDSWRVGVRVAAHFLVPYGFLSFELLSILVLREVGKRSLSLLVGARQNTLIS